MAGIPKHVVQHFEMPEYQQQQNDCMDSWNTCLYIVYNVELHGTQTFLHFTKATLVEAYHLLLSPSIAQEPTRTTEKIEVSQKTQNIDDDNTMTRQAKLMMTTLRWCR